MTNTSVKDPDRRRINRRLHRQKSARLRQSEKLLEDANDVKARMRFEGHSSSIRTLKHIRQVLAGQLQPPHELEVNRHVHEKREHKGRFGGHSGHTSLVVSASRHGPMLYAFCRNQDCRRRVLKAGSLVISGSAACDAIGGIAGECEHKEVVLKRSKHFNVSATCLSCGQSSIIRNAFVESWSIVSKVNARRGGGDSILPRGDPRLLTPLGAH